METESGAANSVRELADSFHERWLAAHPFAASMYGIPGYDGQVPDDSEAGEAAWQDELESVLADSRRTDEAQLSEADGITLGCLVLAIQYSAPEAFGESFDAGESVVLRPKPIIFLLTRRDSLPRECGQAA